MIIGQKVVLLAAVLLAPVHGRSDHRARILKETGKLSSVHQETTIRQLERGTRELRDSPIRERSNLVVAMEELNRAADLKRAGESPPIIAKRARSRAPSAAVGELKAETDAEMAAGDMALAALKLREENPGEEKAISEALWDSLVQFGDKMKSSYFAKKLQSMFPKVMSVSQNEDGVTAVEEAGKLEGGEAEGESVEENPFQGLKEPDAAPFDPTDLEHKTQSPFDDRRRRRMRAV